MADSSSLSINEVNNVNLRIEYKDKSKYTENELALVQRNKHLRDLFYNKVRERQNYLHKCFIKFYYKGIMFQTVKNYNDKITQANQTTINNINMNIIPNLNDPYKDQNQNKENIINGGQNKNINNNNINITNNNEQNNDVNNVNNISNINNINNVNNNNSNEANKVEQNNNNINDTNENKTEEKSENIKKLEDAYSKYSNAQKLRKLLSQKNKKKLAILRKYFHKFHQGGILLSLRKQTKRSQLLKKIEGVDFELALKTVVNNADMYDFEVNETTDVNDFKKEFDKKMKDKRFSDQIEKIRFEEKKRKNDELEKIDELNRERFKNMEILFNKADRRNKVILKKYFEIFYLKSKVMSLDKYERRSRRSKTTKIRKKKKNSMADLSNVLKREHQSTKNVILDDDNINMEKNHPIINFIDEVDEKEEEEKNEVSKEKTEEKKEENKEKNEENKKKDEENKEENKEKNEESQ